MLWVRRKAWTKDGFKLNNNSRFSHLPNFSSYPMCGEQRKSHIQRKALVKMELTFNFWSCIERCELLSHRLFSLRAVTVGQWWSHCPTVSLTTVPGDAMGLLVCSAVGSKVTFYDLFPREKAVFIRLDSQFLECSHILVSLCCPQNYTAFPFPTPPPAFDSFNMSVFSIKSHLTSCCSLIWATLSYSCL
jgi:hypothetical protein